MTQQKKYADFFPYLDNIIRPLVWYSVIVYIVEITTGSERSLTGHPFFLWSERIVACVFTFEYLIRWYRDNGIKVSGYPKSALGIIDLLSVLPFWVGFAVPVSWLPIIRATRILRLLKYFRYSRSLQLVALGFYRTLPQLKALGFAMFIVGLFCAVAVYEAERHAQPEQYNNLFSAIWFTIVSASTVGYGDISPITLLGRGITIIMLVVTLALFGGIIGTLGSSFAKVLEEEADPTIDPIALFTKEKTKRKKKNHD